MTSLVDEGTTVDMVYLDFRKAFYTVSHKIFVEKVLISKLDEQTVKWIESFLNGWARG